MRPLSYKGRIHKAKLSGRSLRYIAADQLARHFPGLQRRWQFPVESIPIAEAAETCSAVPTLAVDGPLPDALARILPERRLPVQIVQNVYGLRDVTVTGQAGAMMKDGRLLAVREHPNWVSGLRPRPHAVRTLSGDRLYYNLVSPMPARGHIFHWLFDFMLPLSGWLEMRMSAEPLTLLVNAERLAFQEASLGVLLSRYPVLALEPVAIADAVVTPRLETTVFVPYAPRALQTADALATLDALADGLAQPCPSGTPKRIYISRDDARLRRVANEAGVMDTLRLLGFERVILKGMPIARQVRLFRDAEAVVAPHGAGLAHIAWCRPGTRIVEIFPSPDGALGPARNATDNFWLISRLRGLDYSAHLGGPRLNRSDAFEIPPALVRHIAEQLSPAAV